MILKVAVLLLLSGIANALVHGVDSSSEVSTDIYRKALSQGFTRAVIRGYQEACSAGGRVDPTMVPSYKNAMAAGYKDIDLYWFPCTGTGNRCKPLAVQVAELSAAITTNGMNVGRIWLDIETDRVCNGWDYGAAGNLAKAKEFMAAGKLSGHELGVYSSATQWENIFGSRGVVLDNTVPLWFAKYDNIETLQLSTPFGGWTTAEGKQYTDKSASKKFDLNVFAS